MTFRFNAKQLTKTVPQTLIVFKEKITESDFIYIGIIGNNTTLDAIRIVEKNFEEVFKVYKQYLVKNQMKLFEVAPIIINTDEQEIYDTFCEVQHILFEK